MDHVNVFAKFEVRSFAPSLDNRGYLKKLGNPRIRPRSFFKIFNGHFDRMDAINVSAKFEVRRFARS